jgi:hypothetical protein
MELRRANTYLELVLCGLSQVSICFGSLLTEHGGYYKEALSLSLSYLELFSLGESLRGVPGPDRALLEHGGFGGAGVCILADGEASAHGEHLLDRVRDPKVGVRNGVHQGVDGLEGRLGE